MAQRRTDRPALEGRSGWLPLSLTRVAPRLLCAVAFFGLFTAHSDLARAGGTLVVGMTAGDIPVMTGNPDQGFEGYRFVGYNLYDALLLCWRNNSPTAVAG